MILDIIFIGILVFSIYEGFKHGLIKTFIDTLGWFISIVTAYIFLSPVKGALQESTNLDQSLLDNINNHFKVSDFNILADSTAQLADFVFTALVFIALVFVVKILLLMVSSLLSFGAKSIGLGFLNKFLGGGFGLIKGFIGIFIILTLFVCFSAILPEGFATFIFGQIESSSLTKFLAENNLILILIEDYLVI